MAGLVRQLAAVLNLAPGLLCRPLDEIMRDTLADEIARGLTRPRRPGLTREQELDVIARA
jgi:2'-hydroxyisoflavone reductase